MSAALDEGPELRAPGLDTARRVAARGWRPLPVDHPDLSMCAGTGERCQRNREKHGDCPREKRGKHPVGSWGTKTASEPRDAMLRLWFPASEPRNVGIACGPSGLLVLDEDEEGALEKLAAKLGEILPSTYRVRTGRGWHWYFADETNEFGNSAGLLADHHIDVRGGHGDGGYVLAAGSAHWTGVDYVAEEPAADVAPLPEWIKELIRTAPAKTVDPARVLVDSDEPEQLTHAHAENIVRQAVDRLAGLKPKGSAFRNAAYYLAKVTALQVRAEGGTHADARSRALVRFDDAHPGLMPDEDDLQWIEEGIEKAGEHRGWELVGFELGGSHPHEEDRNQDSDEAEPAAEELTARELAVRERLRTLEVNAEAQRRFDEATRPRLSLPFADYGVWDEDLESVPLPEMAIGKLVPERGVGFLGGPSGAYKSFVAVSLGIALAHCVPAMGHREFAVKRARKVLYVAAEGSEGVALRTRAARHHAGITDGRRLMVYRRAIDLTSELECADLASFMLDQEFKFLIVDTFRQTTIGVEENSNTEIGAVLARLLAMRDQHSIGSMLLDHTNKSAQGLADLGGAGAKRANADYVIMVDLPGTSRDRDQQRTLRSAKLKDKIDGPTWPIRVEAVPEIVDADGDSSAVVVVGEATSAEEAWRVAGLEWTDRRWRLPADVEALTGRGADAARDLARYMRVQAANPNGTGESRAEAINALRAASGRNGVGIYGKNVAHVRAGWSLLVELKRVNSTTVDAASKSHWSPKDGDPPPPDGAHA